MRRVPLAGTLARQCLGANQQRKKHLAAGSRPARGTCKALPQYPLLAPKVGGLPQKAKCTTERGTADEAEPRFKIDDAIVGWS
jgi:hypothetical protein